ncbi:MAG: TraR/DksA C4-type zinc finger protein [Pseudomonadota bacterium]
MSDDIKQQLQRLEEELSHRLERISSDLTSDHSADFAEQVTERENDDVLRGLRQETIVALAQVKQALRRVDDGSYGICEKCGEEIGAERLKVMPFATRCIRCAE